MHLDGVPVAVIAAWIGHSDPTLTLRVYAHSQDEPLERQGHRWMVPEQEFRLSCDPW